MGKAQRRTGPSVIVPGETISATCTPMHATRDMLSMLVSSVAARRPGKGVQSPQTRSERLHVDTAPPQSISIADLYSRLLRECGIFSEKLWDLFSDEDKSLYQQYRSKQNDLVH
jgi:hypothetical protein